MSDEQLRELERRWKKTETVEDEAAYLRERLRVGELTETQLRLALYLGHPAAQMALNSVDHPRICGDDEVPIKCDLMRFGEETLLRGSLAVAYEALSAHPAELGATVLDLANCISALFFFPSSTPLFQRYHDLVESIEGAIQDDENEISIRAHDELSLEGTRTVSMLGRIALGRLCDAMYYHLINKHQEGIKHWQSAIMGEWNIDDASAQIFIKGHNSIHTLTKHVIGADAVNSAITAELTPWALGYKDPLRERVEAYMTETP